MISCHKCREELAEYALGQADAALVHAVTEHLAACPPCRQELADIEAAWAALPLTLPSIVPTPAIVESVLAKIERQETQRAEPKSPPKLTRRERILSYVVAASVLIGLTAGYVRLTRPGDEEAAARRSVEDLAERLGKLQQLERLVASDQVRLMSLHRPESPARDPAFVVWDLAAGQWHFFADNLPPAPQGRVYQLWAAQSDGTLLPGPTFTVDEQGLGSTVADLPGLNPTAAAKAIVTLEPAGGSKTPTGKVYLEAAL